MAELKLTTCLLDATLFEDAPTTVHHANVEHLYYLTGKNRRVAMKFDLSALPAGAVISSAKLELYAPLPTPTGPVSVYRIIRAWSESTVSWNVPWATAGCENTTSDRSAVAMGAVTMATGWNVINLGVDEFNLLCADNDGLLLVRTGAGGYADTIDVNGRDAASNTPRLTILYSTPDNPPPPTVYEDKQFASGMRYELVWQDHFGARKGVIQAFRGLEYVKAQNKIGSLVFELPRGLYQYDEFSVGDIFEIWREKGGTLELQNGTAYFLQDWEFVTDQSGEEFIRLVAFDANWVLDTAVVLAKSTSAEADKTDYPDDMMKAIVLEQLGSSAVTERQKLAVAPDLSDGGAAITKAFAYRNVLAVLQEICEVAQEQNDVWLGFDVVRTAPGTFEFRTYTTQRGINHSRSSGDPRLVGRQYGNLSEATFGTYHANERNYVIVGGQGEDLDRVLVYRSSDDRVNASKWNRREYFKDSRDDDTTTALEADGDAALDEFKPKQVLTGTLHDTPGMQYGIHYGFGDILTAEAFGFQVDCHVEAVRVKVDQIKGEQLDVKLWGEK